MECQRLGLNVPQHHNSQAGHDATPNSTLRAYTLIVTEVAGAMEREVHPKKASNLAQQGADLSSHLDGSLVKDLPHATVMMPGVPGAPLAVIHPYLPHQ